MLWKTILFKRIPVKNVVPILHENLTSTTFWLQQKYNLQPGYLNMLDSKPEMKILIVDSSLLIIKRLAGLLKERKISNDIFTATGYDETVSLLESMVPDIVLLDIQLPGKNGIELLKFIKIKYPQIKVIVISNLVSKYYQRLCKSLGALVFIDKSKDFDLICDAVLSV